MGATIATIAARRIAAAIFINIDARGAELCELHPMARRQHLGLLALLALSCGARSGLHNEVERSSEPSQCASFSATGERPGLDVFLLLDTSNSMSFVTDAHLTKWEAVRLALEQFFASEQSKASRVAIRRFPDHSPTPESGGCRADTECDAGSCVFLKRCSNNKLCNSSLDCGDQPCTA